MQYCLTKGSSLIINMMMTSGTPYIFSSFFFGWVDVWPLSRLVVSLSANKSLVCRFFSYTFYP